MLKVLTDLTKKKWTLGRSVGTGGFGEIYLAEEGDGTKVRDDARWVINNFIYYSHWRKEESEVPYHQTNH
jgi:hypothetical protein